MLMASLDLQLQFIKGLAWPPEGWVNVATNKNKQVSP